MRICVKDLSGTGTKHDPLSVNYVVVGGLDSTSICWCNVTLESLFNCVVTTILLRIHRPQSLSRRVLPIIRSLQNLQCPWSSLCVWWQLPSYQDPVCTENGTTYDNECLYKLSFCKGMDNNTLYHPGSCEGKAIFLWKWDLFTANKVIWYYQLSW